jgi:hypothetical protein
MTSSISLGILGGVEMRFQFGFSNASLRDRVIVKLDACARISIARK